MNRIGSVAETEVCGSDRQLEMNRKILFFIWCGLILFFSVEPMGLRLTLSPQINADEGKEDFRDKFFELAIDDFRLNLEKLQKLYPVKTICMHGSPLSKWDNRDLGIELATDTYRRKETEVGDRRSPQ